MTAPAAGRGGGKPIRAFLIDDEPVLRAGLRAILAAEGDIEVVGNARDAREAFQDVERLRPDVVVVDLVLPGMDGIAAGREIRHRLPRTQVLILTVHNRATDAVEALESGAKGFALKNEPIEALRAAVRTVARGERYLTPSLRAAVEGGAARAAPDPLAALSVREREIFHMMVRALPVSAVARDLCISPKTVESHIYRIYRKTGCSNIGELIRFAARHDLFRTGARKRSGEPAAPDGTP